MCIASAHDLSKGHERYFPTDSKRAFYCIRKGNTPHTHTIQTDVYITHTRTRTHTRTYTHTEACMEFLCKSFVQTLNFLKSLIEYSLAAVCCLLQQQPDSMVENS